MGILIYEISVQDPFIVNGTIFWTAYNHTDLGGGLISLPTSKHLVQFGMTLIALFGGQVHLQKGIGYLPVVCHVLRGHSIHVCGQSELNP